eukprot:CAMPEP_0172661580 /NCGR_PEP_ID=MMETSP1074-20121228/4799_1 /TAXON_ID=2916 /ORGANISM="Ceratium fusus, Strain PA161109" /LENGTH=31 /DNA_ID= /DNA_START= /DNA_END= /DNA_ORIENTATION=
MDVMSVLLHEQSFQLTEGVLTPVKLVVIRLV